MNPLININLNLLIRLFAISFVAISLMTMLLGCGSVHKLPTNNSEKTSQHTSAKTFEEQLLRHAYISMVDGLQRDAFIFLPRGYDKNSSQQWPVLIYLHGDGERGDGKKGLDYVMAYGPLYEAWVQKRTCHSF